jgi:hypothetical protein
LKKFLKSVALKDLVPPSPDTLIWVARPLPVSQETDTSETELSPDIPRFESSCFTLPASHVSTPSGFGLSVWER